MVGSSNQVAMGADTPYKPVMLGWMTNKDTNKIAQDWRTQIATGFGSLTGTAVSYPLDFIKSRMQSYNTTFTHTVRDTYKAEGARAFYRGIGPPLISITAVRLFSMSLYQKIKYFNDGHIKRLTGKSPLEIANAPHALPNHLTLLCFGTAGATAGAVVTTFSCPFELTKLSEQLAGKMAREIPERKGTSTKTSGASISSKMTDRKQGSWQTAVRLYKERGIARGLFAGYRLHLLRDTIGTAVYFMTYESVKQILANGRGKNPTNSPAVIVAGWACGIFSWTVIYPIDVVKTRYQKALLASETFTAAERPKIDFFHRASYRGLTVSALRSGIVNMVFFSIFEFFKKEINSLPVEKPDKDLD